MTRAQSMYAVQKPRLNAKKTQDNPINKRKKVVLNFVERELLIQKSRNGVSTKKLALDYGIASRTVYDIIRTGDEQLIKFRQDNPNSLTRCTFKKSDYPLVDKALNILFNQVRSSNIIISLYPQNEVIRTTF